jgi:4-amino-4-deoxy-L-arabinose transferase-like glycosyltransferase
VNTQPTITLPKPSPRAWRWLALIAAAHILLGVGFATVVPPLEKLDEFIHWDYIRYLRREGHLPDQRDPYIQNFPAEFHQPPLYYVPGALLTAPIPFSDPPMTWDPINHFGFAFILSSIPDNANGTLHDPARLAFPRQGDWLSLHVLRIYSVLISAAALVPAFWLAWAVFQDDATALGAVGWLAFRPSVLSLNSTVSNDSLMLLTGTVVLALCAWIIARGPTWRRAIWLGVALGLAALTKFTWPATALAVPIAFLLALGLREGWKQRLAQLAATGGIAALLVGWWFVRNLILYGDLTGISLGAQASRPDRPTFLPIRSSPPTWAEAGQGYWTTFRRYWAHFGVVGMPPWVNAALVVLTVLLIVGLGVWIIRMYASRRGEIYLAPTTSAAPTANRRAALFMLIVSLLYAFQSAAMFLVNQHGAQVRYIYAAFAALAVVMQIGLIGLIDLLGLIRGKHTGNSILAVKKPHPREAFQASLRPLSTGGEGTDQPRRPAVGAWSGVRSIAVIIPAIILIPLSLYGLFGVLRPAYDLPHRVSDPALLADEYTQPADVRFGETIRLFGFDISPRTATPGETIFVTLCWESGGPLDEALPYAVHVVDQADGKIGQRNTHPGLGMYATLYWQPVEYFCDRVRVPLSADAPPLETYRVTLSYFHEDDLSRVPATLPNGDEQNLVVLGEIALLPKSWPEPGEPSCLLGGSLALSGLELVEGEAGQSVAVRLQWHALADLSRDYTAFVHVLDSEGQAAAQADVMPRGGRFPTGYWPRGAVVDDQIDLSLADLPPGRYRVEFGVYDSQTVERLPIATPSGEALPDNVIQLGEIEVH